MKKDKLLADIVFDPVGEFVGGIGRAPLFAAAIVAVLVVVTVLLIRKFAKRKDKS